jgi:choline dehydrogenase-like flavoprotein
MADDGSGGVDANLQVEGQEGLFVCDNSVFPTSPAANPSLTLAALALRLADHLRALRWG